jgi:predicted deacylase
VRHNALKHGLLAKEVIVPLGDEYEKRAAFYRLLDDLSQDYAPVGRIEAMLVEMIAVAYWRLRRATRAEVGELIDEYDDVPGVEDIPNRSGAAESLRRQVEAADPNSDFATWLQNEEGILADLGWDLQEVAAHLNTLRADERKPWLLQTLEETKREWFQHQIEQVVQINQQNRALRVQRPLLGSRSSEAVASILRYETTIERQLHRAITQLEKRQATRRCTSGPASGSDSAA